MCEWLGGVMARVLDLRGKLFVHVRLLPLVKGAVMSCF